MDSRYNKTTITKRKYTLIQNNLNINKKDELIITSDRFRTQKQNYDDCLNKLQNIINNECELPIEISEEKKERWKLLFLIV